MGMTAAVCTASATTTLAPSHTAPSTVAKVSFNVNAAGKADKFFPNLEALASREEVWITRILLC